MKSQHFDIAVNRSLEWVVNGHPADDDVSDYLSDHTAFELQNWGQDVCPYCHAHLIERSFEDVVDDNDVWHNNRTYLYRHCENCAYWEFNGAEAGNKCMDAQHAFLLSAIAARFQKGFPPECSGELAQYLRQHPSYWHEIKPRQLEKLVADVFKANYRHAEAIHVGKPYDQGVDVIFIESDGTRWLIQVKRREKPFPAEGFATLQSILGALALDGARHGILVSTADAFSFHARKGQQRAEKQGFIVQMIDKGKLNRMITPLLPETPWREIFGCPDLAHVAKDVQCHFGGPETEGQLSFNNIFVKGNQAMASGQTV